MDFYYYQLPTLVNMLMEGNADRVLIGEAIRAMGNEGEKTLLSIMNQCHVFKVREAILTVFGQLPYCVNSNLTILANSDIHCYIPSPTPRIFYYYTGDASKELPPFLLFDSKELIALTRQFLNDHPNIILNSSSRVGRNGIRTAPPNSDSPFLSNLTYTCRPEITLLYAMACSMKSIIYNNHQSSRPNTSRTNTNHSTSIILNISSILLGNGQNTSTSTTFMNSEQLNNSFSILKSYYLKERKKRRNGPHGDHHPIMNPSHSGGVDGGPMNNRSNNSHENDHSPQLLLNCIIEKTEITTISPECVHCLIHNVKYPEESVRYASVKSIESILSVQMSHFQQVLDVLKKEALLDSSHRVRASALQALAKIGTEMTIHMIDCKNSERCRYSCPLNTSSTTWNNTTTPTTTSYDSHTTSANTTLNNNNNTLNNNTTANTINTTFANNNHHILSKHEKRSLLSSILPLLKDTHWNVRMAACHAMSCHYLHILQMSNFDKEFYKLIFHYLIGVLKDGSISRNQVAKCLSLLEYDGISQLIYLLRQDVQSMNIQVRISCAYGLSLIHLESPYIDRIVESLFMTCSCTIKTPPLVRRAAIKALGELSKKSHNKLTYLGPRTLLPFLYGFLRDREFVVRQMASQVLAQSGPYGELLLMEGLLKDSNVLIRSSAAMGMMYLGPKTMITLLLALFKEYHPHICQHLLECIESFKLDDMIDVIMKSSSVGVGGDDQCGIGGDTGDDTGDGNVDSNDTTFQNKNIESIANTIRDILSRFVSSTDTLKHHLSKNSLVQNHPHHHYNGRRHVLVASPQALHILEELLHTIERRRKRNGQ